MSSSLHRLAVASLVAASLVVLGAPGTAFAQVEEAAAAAEPAPDSATTEAGDGAEQLQESIRVIQQRPVLRALRAELQAMGGVGMSDTLFQHFFVGGTGRFHITEDWSVGLSGNYYFADTSSVFDDVTEGFEVFPEKSLIRWTASVDASFIPINGKFALFDQHIIYFDIYALAGLGVLQTSRNDDVKVGGQLGLGWRIWATRWMSITTEVRDLLYVESFNAGDRFMSHFTFMAGISIFLPFDFEYRFPR